MLLPITISISHLVVSSTVNMRQKPQVRMVLTSTQSDCTMLQQKAFKSQIQIESHKSNEPKISIWSTSSIREQYPYER